MSRVIEIWPNKKFNTTLILAEFPAQEDIQACDRRLLQTGPRRDSYSSTHCHPRKSPEVIYVTSLVMRCNAPL